MITPEAAAIAASGCQNQPRANVAVLKPLLLSFSANGRIAHSDPVSRTDCIVERRPSLLVLNRGLLANIESMLKPGLIFNRDFFENGTENAVKVLIFTVRKNATRRNALNGLGIPLVDSTRPVYHEVAMRITPGQRVCFPLRITSGC